MEYSERQQTNITRRYVSEMEIIKKRAAVISNPMIEIGYLEPTVEFQALQLRKIVEQIILCSLITNSEIYKKFYNRLGSVWNAKYICNDIRKLNPQFFPVSATDYHEKHRIDNNYDITLSEEDILAIHERMGKLLHAHNPFAAPINYQDESIYIKDSCLKIMSFLRTHTIKMYGGNDFLFVVMQAANHGGLATANWFTKVEDNNEIPIQNPALSD